MFEKIISGFNSKTAENLLLDAGAFFKNYDMETDTFETAVTAGKLIGATRGGGQFNATPDIRQIEVDGVKGRAKGLEALDSWEVSLGANVLEVTKDTLQMALGAVVVDTETNQDYDIIKAKNGIALEDYIENITWVGTLSGSNKPAIIQVYNALNMGGLSIQTQSKNEAVLAMTFTGHYDAGKLDNPPFAIYYPKIKVTEGA